MDEYDSDSGPTNRTLTDSHAVSMQVKPVKLGGAASAIPSFIGLILSAYFVWVVYSTHAIGAHSALAGLVVACVWWLEIRYLYAMNAAMEKDQHPAALTVALTQRVRALPVRLWLSIWWGGHVLLIFAVMMKLAMMTYQLRAVADGTALWMFWILVEVIAFWLTYCMVGHLLMAISCWPVQPEALIRIWRMRFWMSLSATIVGFCAMLIAVF